MARPIESMNTLESLSACLAGAFESGDAAILTQAFADAAQAEATAELAAAAGIPQAELRHAFATGEMSMNTTLAIMKVIDLHLPGQAH